MFKKMIVQFDENGKKYKDAVIIVPSQVNAELFECYTSTNNHWDSNFDIVRTKIKKNDPYNLDGRPPTLLSRIVKPKIEFFGNVVYVTGFQMASFLIIGGKILEPPVGKIKGVNYVKENFVKEYDPLTMEGLTLQKIILA